MTIRSLLARAPMLLAGALMASSAFPIGSYSFQRLPDLGFGGRALGFTDGLSGGDRDFNDAIVGSVNNGTGGTSAAVWTHSGAVWTATYLPGQGGSNGRANKGWLDETSLGTVSFIVGEAQDGNGTDNANIWVSVSGSSYTRYQLPTLGGANGRAVSVVRSKDRLTLGMIVVGTTQTSRGNFHATLWNVRFGFPVETYDLGTLGGAKSEVVSVHDDGEIFSAAGRAQTASGAWHACVWRIPSQDGFGSPQIEDRHPGGITSWWSDASGHFDIVAACGGSRTRNGRSIAGFSDISSATAGWTALTAPSANNAVATAIANTRYGNMVFGQVWNDPAKRRSVVWNTSRTLGRTSVYQLGAIGEGASDVNAFIASARSRSAVGSFFDNTSGIEKAFALIANGIQLPDVVAVQVGTPENKFAETDLWRSNDGKTLRIRAGHGSSTSIDSKWEGPDLDASKNIAIKMRARIGGNASAKGVVEIFNFETSKWDFVGSDSFFDIWTEVVVTASSAAHIHPLTGDVRVRAIFTPRTGRVRGVEVDSLYISSEL